MRKKKGVKECIEKGVECAGLRNAEERGGREKDD